MISVKEISSGAYSSWDVWVDSYASFFTKDSVVLLVGQVAMLPINNSIRQDFIITDMSDAYANVDTLTKKITALAVGSTYYMSVNYHTQTVDTLRIIIIDALPSATQMTSVAVLDNGYTLEVTFDRPVTLYEGIANDFLITDESTFKAATEYAVTGVRYKGADHKTLVLTLAAPVPASGFSVKMQDLKTYSVSTHRVDVYAADVHICPHPARNKVTITALGLKNVEIISLTGQRVASAEARNDKAELSVDHLPAGKYSLRYATDSGYETQVLVIE